MPPNLNYPMAFSIFSEKYAFFCIDNQEKITFWNGICENITGIPADKALGSAFDSIPFYSLECPVLKVMKGEEQIFFGTATLSCNGEDWPAFCIAWRNADKTGFSQCMMPRSAIIHDNYIDGIESGEDYRKIIDNIGDGFLLNQKNRLVLVNRALAKIWEYDSPDEVIGRPATDFIAESHRQEFLEHHQKKIEGVGGRHRWPHLTKTGRIIWLEGHPKRIMWKGQPAMISTLVDVTEARRREKKMRSEANALREENARLRHSLIMGSWQFQDIVGKSEPMRNVYERLMKASEQNASIIIYGETGTGKELAAKAIHALSDRADKPFIAVNCGAIPEGLMESEFFGVKKGAFTDARADRKGYFDQADGGFLFLDEVGELPLSMQVKLLRALETHSWRPVGSTELHKGDIRIITATNRSLVEEIAKGAFREDLFYRLHVIPITLPPLREHKEDIPLLFDYILRQYGDRYKKLKIPAEVMEKMQSYEWPGNVREFNNTVRRWLALGTLDLIHSPVQPVSEELTESNLALALGAYEKKLILEALRKCGGNRSATARSLGISRRSLYRKMKEWDNLATLGQF